MKTKGKEAFTRATVRLPAELWKRAQHAAIDRNIPVQELVALALAAFLKGGN